MIVAIHQPNYLPWLGFFAKMARADVFVLLDDVQFSKGSYTNRVKIARRGAPAWLTVPIRHAFGASIRDMAVADADFARSHLDILRQSYLRATAFAEVWPSIVDMLTRADGTLAAVNAALVRAIAHLLHVPTRIVEASGLGVPAGRADERLAALVAALAPGGTYLSGTGGASYQSEEAFAANGLTLRYSDFRPRAYPRSGEAFLPGLSVVDALFHCGVDETARMVRS